MAFNKATCSVNERGIVGKTQSPTAAVGGEIYVAAWPHEVGWENKSKESWKFDQDNSHIKEY